MRFNITKPSVWMYATDDLCGEVSDELLFGTVIKILSENDTCVYCETDYGYKGYINKWELCECTTEDCGNREKQYIYERCDVLPSPEYGYAPVMSLPVGARVKTEWYNDRFSLCYVGQKRYYISNYSLRTKCGCDFGKEFTDLAKSYIGTPYRWGGKSDIGIDCSGLAFMCARLCGKSLYRDSVPKEEYVDIISEASAVCGDLIYFKGHVAIKADGDNIIHSSARFGKVIYQPFDESGLSRSDILCYASLK